MVFKLSLLLCQVNGNREWANVVVKKHFLQLFVRIALLDASKRYFAEFKRVMIK